jgi:hypothetical protein
LGFGNEFPKLVDLLFAELDLEAVLARDLLLAVIADRVGIQPPLADPLAAQLAREAVGVSNRLECPAEPLLAVVITFRDDKIVDMQGCATRGEAEQFARRQT